MTEYDFTEAEQGVIEQAAKRLEDAMVDRDAVDAAYDIAQEIRAELAAAAVEAAANAWPMPWPVAGHDWLLERAKKLRAGDAGGLR